LELVEGSSHLQFYLAAQFNCFIQPNEGSKLGVQVINVELSRFKLDFRVQARYTDILQSDLALVSSPHFDRVLVLGTDHMQTALLLAFLALVDALQDEIGGFRLLNGDHFH
jgi:hypothetical protein